MSDGSYDFSEVLMNATAVASGTLSATNFEHEGQPIFDSLPYRAFRQSIDLDVRRREGIFFSGPSLSRELAGLLHERIPVGGLALDPTCGIGDLLLSYAQRLPIKPTLPATLDAWGKQLAGIEKRADLVAMAKARLVALARSRGGFFEPVASIDCCFPEIVVGDMFKEPARIAQADGFLVNPPFGQTADHAASGWCAGRISTAALCLDGLVKMRSPGAPIAAVLPEVLRCGTRYARFRSRLAEAGLGGHFMSRGRFDAWTDVDVFTTLLEHGPPGLWAVHKTLTETVGDRFVVKVGAVVPHRHAKKGPWQRFVCARTVPPGSTGFVPVGNRRFRGTTSFPPFVVVRRTSSPSDRKRAVATIILGDRAVAVENHLIVLTPIDSRFDSCVELLAVLTDNATSDHLNGAMRCRHLTTVSVKEIPWIAAK